MVKSLLLEKKKKRKKRKKRRKKKKKKRREDRFWKSLDVALGRETGRPPRTQAEQWNLLGQTPAVELVRRPSVNQQQPHQSAPGEHVGKLQVWMESSSPCQRFHPEQIPADAKSTPEPEYEYEYE
ncbi:unnamed protein product [Pleuronectes platessa]|uniref:Uncharacterized protein n=1 Tax=Pleuronectes platessa TaxID=8262 RepID=A0A9N7UAU7_PLEPL|nr:unnamed protein product [Pleuronectes platessa]